MFNPLRLRVRGLLVLVALVALAFGLTSEIRVRRDLRRVRDREFALWTEVAWHYRQADRCLAGRNQAEPYSFANRRAEWAKEPIKPRILRSAGNYSGWELERSTHQYWGARLEGEAIDRTEERKALERRLWLP